jgi:hypothetical protein
MLQRMWLRNAHAFTIGFIDETNEELCCCGYRLIDLSK